MRREEDWKSVASETPDLVCEDRRRTAKRLTPFRARELRNSMAIPNEASPRRTSVLPGTFRLCVTGQRKQQQASALGLTRPRSSQRPCPGPTTRPSMTPWCKYSGASQSLKSQCNRRKHHGDDGGHTTLGAEKVRTRSCTNTYYAGTFQYKSRRS